MPPEFSIESNVPLSPEHPKMLLHIFIEQSQNFWQLTP